MRKYLLLGGAVALLVVQFLVQLNLAKIDSATTDEAVHLSAGYTYVAKGDFRFNPEHPPLVKILSGLSILHLHPKTTPQMDALWDQSSNYFYDSWRENRDYGEMLLYQAGNNPDQILFWARLPIVILTLILGLTIFLIAWREWGVVAAFTATAIYALDPTINGHGHLVTTDIGAALGYLLVIYSGWKFLQKRSWKWSILFGLSLSVALLSKHTTIIAFPALLLLLVIEFIRTKDRVSLGRALPKLLVSFIVVWLATWAIFGFNDRTAPSTQSITNEYRVLMAHRGDDSSVSTNPNKSTADKAYTAVQPFLKFLPGDYVKGVFMVIGHVSNGQQSFLLGETSVSGWWYYFPVLIFFKTPIPTLAMLAISLWYLAKKRPVNTVHLGILIGGLAFLGFAMLSKADLGIRHILPVLPVLFITCGYAISELGKSIAWRNIFIALFVWLGLIFCFSYPFYISYFNNFIGGSYHGYKVATDSNLDWGQDEKRIADYIHSHNITNVYLEYNWNGISSLDYYLGSGTYHQLSSHQPGDGGYAILGASAFDGSSDYQYLHSCNGLGQITPGVFICKFDQ